jgi:hypothetical protein
MIGRGNATIIPFLLYSNFKSICYRHTAIGKRRQ